MTGQHVDYCDGNAELQGYLALPEHSDSPRPLVLVAHAWAGRSQFECEAADRLASLGYAGFALDNYGRGVLGSSMEENQQLMTPFMEDRQSLRQRLLAGLDAARQQPGVDASRVAAIGFCFGGLCVLDLARAGHAVTGDCLKSVVSFHGLFTPPENTPASRVDCSVLALHGHDDPMVPPEQVLALEQELTAAGADWQIHSYGHTSHAFTHPQADMADKGLLYQPRSAQRAWQAMAYFLDETLA